MTALKPYPEYKDSGVEWLGFVPAGWVSVPLWSLFRRSKTASIGTEELLSVYRDFGVIPKSSRDDNFNRASDDLSKYQLVEVGDLVINKMKAWQGSVAVSTYTGIVSPAYFVLKPQADMNLRFMHYLMRSASYFQFYAAISKGVRPNQWDLDPDQHRMLPVLLPPLEDQRDIALFLDHETAEIDAFIADQQELIGLLNERRAATITQAVTKGLDPNVPMKDSGVEWLGEVPQHWTVEPVKRFFRSLDSQRVPLSSEERSYRRGPFPYYGASGVIDQIDDYIYDEPLILVSEDGANLRARSTPIAFVATDKYWVNNHAHILKPIDDAVYFWAARIEAEDVNPWVTGAAQPKLTIAALMNLVLSVPPSEQERREIEDFVEQQTAEIDAAIADAKEAIELSKERRAALISAAVTGKIDVRDHPAAKGAA